MVPGKPLYIDGVSYWIPDVEMLRLSVADSLGIHVDPALRERFERAAGEYKNSIPSNAADVPAGDNSIGSAVRNTRGHIRERSSYDNETTRQSYDGRTDDYFENRSSINADRGTSSNSSRSNTEDTYRSRSNTYTRRESSTEDDIYSRNDTRSRSHASDDAVVPTVEDDYSPPSRSDGGGKMR